MATWHQQQRPVKLYHATQWTVIIDPPNQMRACMLFGSRELAEVYMRGLKAGVAEHSYILKPAK